MGWTPLFLQYQPLKNSLNFWAHKIEDFAGFDQKPPEKSLIFQIRKSMILDDVVSL